MSYNANVMVEKSNQIIVSAELDNQPSEHHLIPAHIDTLKQTFSQLPTYVLGDSAYANQATIHYLNQQKIQPVCPQFQIQYYRTHTKPNRNTTGRFSAHCFTMMFQDRFMLCPAKQLLKKNALQTRRGRLPFYEYSNPKACRKCPLRKLCTSGSYRIVKRGIYANEVDSIEDYLHTFEGQTKYKDRMGIVEPVFGNIKWNKGFKLTFRGISLAHTQFKLACIMHNLEKLAKSRGFGLFPNPFYSLLSFLPHRLSILKTFSGLLPVTKPYLFQSSFNYKLS